MKANVGNSGVFLVIFLLASAVSALTPIGDITAAPTAVPSHIDTMWVESSGYPAWLGDQIREIFFYVRDSTGQHNWRVIATGTDTTGVPMNMDFTVSGESGIRWLYDHYDSLSALYPDNLWHYAWNVDIIATDTSGVADTVSFASTHIPGWLSTKLDTIWETESANREQLIDILSSHYIQIRLVDDASPPDTLFPIDIMLGMLPDSFYEELIDSMSDSLLHALIDSLSDSTFRWILDFMPDSVVLELIDAVSDSTLRKLVNSISDSELAEFVDSLPDSTILNIVRDLPGSVVRTILSNIPCSDLASAARGLDDATLESILPPPWTPSLFRAADDATICGVIMHDCSDSDLETLADALADSDPNLILDAVRGMSDSDIRDIVDSIPDSDLRRMVDTAPDDELLAMMDAVPDSTLREFIADVPTGGLQLLISTLPHEIILLIAGMVLPLETIEAIVEELPDSVFENMLFAVTDSLPDNALGLSWQLMITSQDTSLNVDTTIFEISDLPDWIRDGIAKIKNLGKDIALHRSWDIQAAYLDTATGAWDTIFVSPHGIWGWYGLFVARDSLRALIPHRPQTYPWEITAIGTHNSTGVSDTIEFSYSGITNWLATVIDTYITEHRFPDTLGVYYVEGTIVVRDDIADTLVDSVYFEIPAGTDSAGVLNILDSVYTLMQSSYIDYHWRITVQYFVPPPNVLPVLDFDTLSIPLGSSFGAIELDSCVTDPDDPDSILSYTVSGGTNISFTLVGHRLLVTVDSLSWTGLDSLLVIVEDWRGWGADTAWAYFEVYRPTFDIWISIVTGDVRLDWSKYPNADEYKVYRSTNDPYFSPSAPPLTTTTDTFFTDAASHTGDTLNQSYYIVEAIKSGSVVHTYGTVGEFDYPLYEGAGLATDANWVGLVLFNDDILMASQLGSDIPFCTAVSLWDVNEQTFVNSCVRLGLFWIGDYTLNIGYPYQVNVPTDEIYTLVGKVPPSWQVHIYPSTGTDQNVIVLPLDATVTTAAELGASITGCTAVSVWDPVTQQVGRSCVYIAGLGFWIGNFSVHPGGVYLINATEEVIWP